jgi:LacI family transcriptional regulator
MDAPVPTLRDLALLANVSRTTVSLSLRNHPSIPAHTRIRIHKLAAAHGYRQDPVVSTLMTQLRTSRAKRTIERIAYFTAWDTRDGWRQGPNERNFFLGASARATKLGYEIDHIWAREPGINAARLSKILYTRSIRGLIIGPFINPRSHIRMDWAHFSTAAISHTLVRPLVHRTSHGHYAGMFLALRNVRHHGYRRIGFATRLEQSERVDNAWLAALLVQQQSLPLAQRVPPLLSPGPPTSDIDPVLFAKWYHTHKPDVVVSNLTSPLDMLKSMGLSVPKDVGYASLDLVNPDSSWSGVDQQPTEVGAAAVDQVVTQLQNNEIGLPKYPRTVYLEGVWREGSTLLAHRIAAAS